MSTVVFAIAYAAFDAPAGTVVSDTEINIVNPDGTSQQIAVPAGSTSLSATVTQIGNYTANLGSFDQNGNAIGTPVSVSFVVAGSGTVSVQIPASITAIVS